MYLIMNSESILQGKTKLKSKTQYKILDLT